MSDYKVLIPNKSLTAVRLNRLPAVSDIKKVNLTQMPYIDNITKTKYLHNSSGTPLVYTNTYPVIPPKPFTLKTNKNKNWEKVVAKSKLLNNTNDSKELNSLADIFWGLTGSVIGKDGYAGFKKGYFSKRAGWLNKIPITSALVRMGDLAYRYYKPLSKGEFTITGLNFLQGIGEDADVLANVIKGATIETVQGFITGDFKEHNLLTGMVNSTVSSSGRKTYNYDLDPNGKWDGIINFALEMVSDPINWVSLGAKSFIKKGITTGEAKIAKTFVDTGLNTIVESVGEEGTKKWMRSIMNSVARGAVRGEIVSPDDIAESLLKNANKYLGSEVASQITTDAMRQVGKTIAELVQTNTEKTAFKIAKSLMKFDDIATAPSRAVLTAPFKAIKKIKKTYNTRVLRSMQPFLKGTEETFDILDYTKLMTHVSNNTDALIAAAEQSGIKGLESGTIRNLVKRNTRETIKDIQEVLFNALHTKKTMTDLVAVKNEILKYLVDKKGWDSSKPVEEWFTAYLEAINKLAEEQPTFKKLIKPMEDLGKKLTILNENIAFQQSPAYKNAVAQMQVAKHLFENAKQLQDFIDKNPEEIVDTIAQATEDAKRTTDIFKSFDTSETTLALQRECATRIADAYLRGSRKLNNEQLDSIIAIILTSENNIQANRTIRSYFKNVLGVSVNKDIYDQIYNIIEQYTNPDVRAYADILKNVFHTDTTGVVITKDIQNSIDKLLKYVKEGPIASKEFNDTIQRFKNAYGTFIKTETDAISGKSTKSLIKESFDKINKWAKAFTDDFNNFTAPVYKEGVRAPIVSTKITKTQAKFLQRVSKITNISEETLVDVFKNMPVFTAESFIGNLKVINNTRLKQSSINELTLKNMQLTDKQFTAIKNLYKQYSNIKAVKITKLKIELVKPLQELFGKNNSIATNVSKAINYYFDADTTTLQIIKPTNTEKVIKLTQALDEAFSEIESKNGLLQSGVATGRYNISRLGERINDTANNIDVTKTIEDIASQIGDTIKIRETAFKNAEESLTKLLESFNDNIGKFSDSTVIATVEDAQQKITELFQEQAEKHKIPVNTIADSPKWLLKTIAPDSEFNKTAEAFLYNPASLKSHWDGRTETPLQIAYQTFVNTDYNATGNFNAHAYIENYRFFRNSVQRLSKEQDEVLDKAAYNALLEQFDKLEREYPTLNEASETKLINVSGDVHYYMLKQEQIKNAQTFIQDDTAMAFIKYIHDGVAITEKDNILSYTNQEYVNTLLEAAKTDNERQIIMDLADAANKVKTACDSVIQASELIDNINNSTVLSGSRKQAFLSTLMRTDISSAKVENIYSDINKINEIINNTERFINGTRQIRKFTLDDFRAHHADLFPTEWQHIAHHADTDNITTFKFIETELPDINLKDTDWAMDIETTGLQANSGEVLEIGLTNKSGQGVLFKRNLNPTQDFVDSSLYDLWYKDLPDTASKKAAFYDYFNKSYNGPTAAQQVYYFDTEAELLTAVCDFAKAGGLQANVSNIYMHNGMDFDMPFLTRRATLNGVNEFADSFKNYNIIDTYKQIQKKYNFVVLDASEKYEMTQIFSEYIAGRISTGHAEEQFINALPSDLITGLSDFYKINKDYQKSFIISEMSEASAIVDYNNMAKHLKKLLVENIKNVNRGDIEAGTAGLNSIIFSADSLNTPEFQQKLFNTLYDIIKNIDNEDTKLSVVQQDVFKVLSDFVKAVKDKPQYADIDFKDPKAVLKAYLETMNPSKALYTVPSITPMVGYKTLWDSKIVNTWFSGYADMLPEKQAQQIYNLAAYFDRQVKYLVNAKAITPYRDTLDAFLINIKTYLMTAEETKIPANWQYLMMNSDAIANKYVLAKHIYDTLTTHKQYTPLLNAFKKDFSVTFQNIEELFTQDFRFRHNTVGDTGLTYTEYLTDLSKDEWFQANKYYGSLAEELKAEANNFSLAEKLDETGLFTPALQATANGARNCYHLLQDFADMMDRRTLQAQSKVQQQVITVTDNLAVQTLRNLYSDTSVENITNVLAHSYGISTFNINDAPDIFQALLKNEAEYKNVGINLYVDGNTNRVWLYFDNSKINLTCDVLSENHNSVKHIYVNDNEINALHLKELDVNKAVTNTPLNLNPSEVDTFKANIIKVRDTLHRYSNNNSVGIHGDLMNRKTIRAIYESAPEAIQHKLLSVDDITNNNAWFCDNTYNISNLGSGRYRRQIQQGVPLNLLQTYKVNTQIALQSANAKLKYVNYILNGDMRLDVGLWSALENEEALFSYIKAHPEMVVAVPVKKKSSIGFDIKRVAINSIEDLQNAKRLKASLLTRETYSKAASVIHTNNFNDGVLGVWSKLSTLYKIGQLSVFNLGTLSRNFLDSVIKEIISTGSIVGTVRSWHETIKDLSEYKKTLKYCMATEQLDTEVIERIARAYNVSPADILKDIEFDAAAVKMKGLKEVINATALYTKYNTCIDDIIKMDSNSILRPQNIEFYFKYIAQDFDIDTFYAVHKFITEGASAGATPELQEIFSKEFAKQGLPEEDSSGLWQSVMHISRKLSKPNYDLEQIIRLSQHMQQLRQGMSFTESSYKIAKVHFDYADKTDVTRFIELLIPFYNFKMKNFEYWADLIDKEPWVWHLYTDVMTPIWNFDSYDTYGEHLELANNQSLQYNIMAGNIVLNNTGMTLKLNPSIQDAIQMSTDPFGNAQSSLFAPLQYGFKQALYAQAREAGLPEYVKNIFDISDYYVKRKQSFVESGGLQTLPLVGASLSRFKVQGPKYYKITKNPLNRIVPSLFGATSRWDLSKIKSPEEWSAQTAQLEAKYNARKTYKNTRVLPKKYKPYTGYKKYKGYKKHSGYKRSYIKPARKTYIPYTKKTYYNSSYPTAFTTYYNPKKQPRKYYPIQYKNYAYRPKTVYARNIYWKYYTKKGKRRMDILGAKTTKKNLQAKIKLMYNYYK